MSILSDQALSRRDALAQSFANAAPFRHVVIEDFFENAFTQGLLDGFPRFEDRYALNEMGQVGGKAVRMDVRDLSPSYGQLDALLQTREFLDYVSAVTGIPDLLYDAEYIGGGTHENRQGQGLDAHVDFNYHPRTKWHRRLNLIVYLNHEWEDRWGGLLELHSDPWNPAKNHTVALAPLFNRAVIFETTETSWHGFSAIDLPAEKQGISRKSFAIYLYTRERPPQETAPPHATIYVPDAMPAQLQAGKLLSGEDVADLQGRFTRMRTQLRYLYEREKQFGAQIAALEHAIGEAHAAQKADLQGYATQQGAQGLWPDGWAARELHLRFTPTRRAKRLELDLWVPDAMKQGQRLVASVGGHTVEKTLHAGSRVRVELPFNGVENQPQELRVVADHAWQPSAGGNSGDERALAYRLLGIELAH